MYVIFPADELILLTYGIAVPRVHQRPTLDNLREPVVPLGNRPNSATTPSPNQINEARRNQQSLPFSPSQTPPTVTSRERSPSVNFSSNDQIYDYNETEPVYFTDTVGNYTDKHRSLPPLTTSIALPKSPNSSASAGKGKEKPKSLLHLKLGRLRPHSSVEQSESARIREDLHIHVSNPVFTRENLRQRNFDAFFESGETVYSLEKKEKTTPTRTDFSEGGSSWNAAFNESPTQQRSISVGLFRKAISPISTTSVKSGEIVFEEPQKGDRCP